MLRTLVACLFLFPLLVHAADITVEVSGVDDKARDNVLAFLSIQQYRDKKDLSETMIRRMHARAPAEIRRALMVFGYYQPEISARLDATPDGWQAHYAIEPGPPVRVNDISVKILADPQVQRMFEDIIQEPPLKRGERLNHGEYSRLKNALMNRATQRGFLQAEFRVQRLAVNTETLKADITLELEPGPRFYFGDITIHQEILDDDFVRRYLDFETGDPLNYEKLIGLQFALTDSEYYSTVQVEAQREQAGPDHFVPVEVNAVANERTRYNAGLGYGTDTGARITLGFQRRYVNTRGHRLAAEVRLSEVEDTYSMRYTIPLEDPARESFQLFAGTLRADRGDTESYRVVLGASRVRTLGDWEQTLYLRGEREDSRVPTGEFRTESLIPGASWLKTDADDLFYTRDGYKLYFDVHGSHPSLGSTTDYVQGRFLGKVIFPFGDRWRLLLRGEAGATTSSKASRLPVSQRFFAGGDYSVRGYDYNSLGPPDENDKVVGGQYLLTSSAEIEYRFADSWAVVAFTDAGNAMNDLNADLKRSVGIGLRWISPVGVVRVDLAHPLNADVNPPGGVELHISVGPDL